MDLQTLITLKLTELNASEKEKEFAVKIFSNFPINRLGFELASFEKSLDVGILLRRNSGDFYHFSNVKFRKVFEKRNWEKIASILNLLNNSRRYNDLNSLWFEFDIKYYSNSYLPVPGIYLSVDELQLDKSLEVIASLLSRNLYNKIKDSFSLLIQNIRTAFTIEHVGFFPVRGNNKVRFVFRLTYENAVKLLPDYRIYNSEILDLIKMIEYGIYSDVCIHFDVSETGTELQGIEVYPVTKSLKTVLRKLVKLNWFSEENFVKAMSWKCAYAFPANMKKVLKTKLDHRIYPYYYAARVSHVKIINTKEKISKVYLGSEFFGYLEPDVIESSLTNRTRCSLEEIHTVL